MDTPAKERPKPPPLQLNTATYKPRIHTVAERFSPVIENGMKSPIQALLAKPIAYRPRLPQIDEHEGPQISPTDRDLKEVETKAGKLKERITSPCKTYTLLREKPLSAKKPVASRGPVVVPPSLDEYSDFSAYESNSTVPIAWHNTPVYSKIKPHGAAYFAAVTADLKAEAVLVESKQEALRAKAQALEQAGKPTTVGGFQCILDDGRTLDTEISYPASLLPAQRSPKKLMQMRLARSPTSLVERVENVGLNSGSYELACRSASYKAQTPKLGNTEETLAKDQRMKEKSDAKHQAAHQVEAPSSVAIELEPSADNQITKKHEERKKYDVKGSVDEGGVWNEDEKDIIASVVYSDSEYSQDE